MSLPPTFGTPEDYFTEFMHLIRKYKHLFIVPNTELLVENVLDQICIENVEEIDASQQNVDLAQMRGKNQYLDDFFEKIETLKPDFNGFVETDFNVDANLPLSPKKRHEIVYLAKEIERICKETDCDTVVDFGCGLGYLDQLLYQTSNLKVLGLECNETNYVGAKKRQRKYHPDSIDHVKYIKHTITVNSDEKITEYLHDKFPNYTGFCIAGLHACADLTVDALNLFLKMADAKAIVIMPCCYHKMKKRESEEIFVNFPVSNELKGIFAEFKGDQYLRVPFLRLASQPPNLKEGRIEDSVFNLLSRAVLQLYASRHKYKLKRNKRKAVKLKTTGNDFSNYVRDAANGFTLYENEDKKTDSIESIDFDSDELDTIWREISNVQQKTAIFIILQNILQPLIENFILYDRILYLSENFVNNCSFKRILDKKISPRCLALVAKKEK